MSAEKNRAAEALAALSQLLTYDEHDSGALRRIFDLIESIAPGRVVDPVSDLVAEHFRLEAECSASCEEADEDAFRRAQNEVDKLINPLDQRAADTVACSAAGLCAQLWLLREMGGGGGAWEVEREDQMFRSIVLGIISLALERQS
jgi:hypothetical protein